MELHAKVQSRNLILSARWVSTLSKLLSMDLDFHLWSNLKQVYPLLILSWSMTTIIFLLLDIWLTPPSTCGTLILYHNLLQKYQLFKIKLVCSTPLVKIKLVCLNLFWIFAPSSNLSLFGYRPLALPNHFSSTRRSAWSDAACPMHLEWTVTYPCARGQLQPTWLLFYLFPKIPYQNDAWCNILPHPNRNPYYIYYGAANMFFSWPHIQNHFGGLQPLQNL